MTYYQILDIETAPDSNAPIPECPEDYIQQGIRENFKPETRAAYEEKNRAAWPAEYRRRASLDWRIGTITCASVTSRSGDGVDVCVVVCGDAHGDDWIPPDTEVQIVTVRDESKLLDAVWDILAATDSVVGFAIRDFDWPWLLGRSAVWGVTPSLVLRGGRYGRTDLIDWADILTWYGAFARKGWTLGDYARQFALPYQPWGDGVGAVEAWEEGRVEDLMRHCVMDGLTTLALHERFAPMLGTMG